MSNPPLVFASTNTVNQASTFAPILPLPPQIAIVSLQLLPAGFNLSSFFAGDSNNAQDAFDTAPPASSGMILLRLRHIFQAGLDDPSIAISTTVDLANVFSPHWTISSVTELTVDASDTLTAAQEKQISWIQSSPLSGNTQKEEPTSKIQSAGFSVTLEPMEIKTLLLTIN